ncbi:hemerythrin domain-containing protein [Microbulbifer yueqingensis]|uniref:Hemerythrin HHE cation binding domain-containing protein n=1 Tax=Microbulbifer yueqingensis TaxID=658219 RepID=A0A1G8V002_9GAMM|nr:hemerythrin domain-containing protein [Microbulbifer yueqingensis]SDJ59422.1 Hemerythrin HHE cation binding domain-containing protein [Microbulbifer yueqingensis]
MDIYERLKKDHETQRELAADIMHTSGDSPERRSLWKDYRREAEAHAAAEEQVFYAALMEKPAGQDKARHSVAEHKQAADIIEELADVDMGSGGWIQKFEKLKELLEHHMDEEEQEIFQCARQVIDDDRASEMPGEFDQRKNRELGS